MVSMRAVKREVNTPDFVPDYMAKSISDIDFELLAKRDIGYVAFDADSTLVPFRGIEIAPPTLKFLKSKQKLFKDWCIATNRITHDLQGLAISLQAGIVQAGWLIRKPRRAFFDQVLRHFGNPKPAQVVMIGDKLRADIWGAKRAGFVTVWVEHLGKDNPLDTIIRLRQIERRLLGKYL